MFASICYPAYVVAARMTIYYSPQGLVTVGFLPLIIFVFHIILCNHASAFRNNWVPGLPLPNPVAEKVVIYPPWRV